MARHRLDRRRVKIHRSYTVEEIARLLGTCRATVRRWLKNGLSAIDGQRPAIIRGPDLVEFLTARVRPKTRCLPGYCYCVKCRMPHTPAGAMAEFVVLTATSGNLRGLCPACGTMMHRRMAAAQLEDIRAMLEVTIVQGVRPLTDSSVPSQNVHFEEHSARA
jgi:hypothetical protein